MEKLYTPAEILAQQQKDEEPIAQAVTDILLPNLTGDALTIAQGLIQRHYTTILYGGMEAVSLLIQRYAYTRKNELLYFTLQGHLCDGNMGISVDSSKIAIEIARFTNLWEDVNAADEDLVPSKDAEILLAWLFNAMEQQPHLLRHFKAMKTNDDWIRLDPVALKDIVDDPAVRWAKK